MKIWMTTLSLSFVISFSALAQQIKSVQVGEPTTVNEEDFVKFFAESANKNGTLEAMGTKSEIKPQAILSHSPKGIAEAPVDPSCTPKEFERLTIKSGLSAKDFGKIAKSFFDRCEKSLTYRSTKGLIGLLEFSMAEYHFTENPKVKPITFKFDDNSILYGFIGIKDNNSKRPWVIAKCGVFCSAGESASVNNYMMHLFDQSPFNIIFLGNRSGTDYIKANNALTIGGYLEAHDFFEVSRWLTERSGLQNTIDSIHALGISLAGNASSFSSVLEKHYPAPRRAHYLDSTISICPVINLHPTLKDMFANSLKGEIFVRYSWSELKKVKDDLPEFAHYLQKSTRPPKEEFPFMMGDMIAHYGSQWDKHPGNSRKGPPLNNIEDLWNLNQFTNESKVDIPLLVWASKDDSIVNNEINTQALEQSYIGQNSANVGIINLNYGNHCGFSTVYGYPAAASVLRSWVLNHSPQFLAKRKVRNAVVDFATTDAPRGSVFTRTWLVASKGSNQVKFNAEYYKGSSGDTTCDDKAPFMNSPDCYTTRTSKIPLSQFSFLGVSIPNSDTEAEVLTRRLNSTILFNNKSNLPVEGGRRAPSSVQWYSYY